MRALRAAGAGLLLLLLVAGVPVALAVTVGSPLGSWPDLLAGDVTDRVIVDILTAVAYLAWAQFAVATVVELVSALRRTPMPRPIPGVFGGQQQLARALVTAALLLMPTVASAVAPPVQALAALPGPALATRPALPAAAPERAGTTGWPVYTVTADGPSTFWDLADTTLGSGDRWREVWQANMGRTQVDGTVLDAAVVLQPGWTVLVPRLPADDTGTSVSEQASQTETVAADPATDPADAAAADTPVTVRPGDTLSEIAAEHGVDDWQRIWPANQGRQQPGGDPLTDPDLIEPGWTVLLPAGDGAGEVTVAAGDTLSGIAAAHGADLYDVIAANTGRPQPDGRALTDPDLIEPGWTITIPDDHSGDRPTAAPLANGPAPAAPPDPAPPAPATADQGPKPAAPESEAPRPAAPKPAAPHQPSTQAVSTAPATATPPAGTGGATVTTPPVERPASDAAADDDAEWPAWAVIAAGGTLLAGSALTVLRRHRRSQMRRRPPGRFIAATPADVLDTERVLLAAGGDSWDRTQWMDRAMRSLVTTRGPSSLPDVIAVRLADDGLELLLRQPQPAVSPPWTAGKDALRWHLHRTDQLTFAEEDRPFHYAPYPALVTVGQADNGDTWLLDLEAARYLPVTGNLSVAGDFARFLATELATNVWSEIMSVTLCGLGPELSDLDPQRLRVDTDLTAAVTRLRHQAQDVTDRSGPMEAAVLDGRRDGTDGDRFAPEVLIVAGSAADSPEVDRAVRRLLATDARSACAVVACRGDNPDQRGGLAVSIDPAGRLAIPALGLDLRAARASAADSADLAALFDHARTAGHRPMPRPADGNPLNGATDDAGLITDLHPARAADGDRAADPVDIRSLLPEPVEDYVTDAAATAEDVTVLAPEVPADTADRLGTALTGLDLDLADWHDATSDRPKVAVLGPVQVAARGDLPEGHPRRAWNAEMIAYLATRENGATVEELGAAMWPGEADVTGKSKLRNAVYIARKWLGPNPATGRDHLPSQKGAQGATYRLEDVLLDADLFVRLRVRAQARGGRDGIRDLRAALDLVTGPPFDQRRPGGYSWLAGNPLDYQYQAMIVDVAHTVATHHLAAGEPAQAEWAARVALLAGSQEDTPLLDLVAACHQQGDTAAADQHVRAIMANHDADIEEDLPTRTYEILLRHDWLPTGAGARRATG